MKCRQQVNVPDCPSCLQYHLYKIEKEGVSTYPFGTPTLTDSGFEHSLFTNTFCFLSLTYSLTFVEYHQRYHRNVVFFYQCFMSYPIKCS